jgi:hypothetical protein
MSVWNYALKKKPPQAKGGGLSWERVVAGRMMEDVTAGGLVAPTCRAVVNEGGNRMKAESPRLASRTQTSTFLI